LLHVKDGHYLTINLPNLHRETQENDGIYISLKLIHEFYQKLLDEKKEIIEEKWQEVLKEFILSICFEKDNQLIVVALCVCLSAYIKVF